MAGWHAFPSGLIIGIFPAWIFRMNEPRILEIVNQIRALILDMDGVLWRDTQPIGNLSEIFSTIHENGWSLVLVTNNATKSTDQYVDKLRSFGVDVEGSQIVTTATTTSYYLSTKFPLGGPVYVIGEEGLLNTLEEYGFYFSEENPVAVISSLDRTLTYQKLRKASHLINAGTLFIGTNPDRALPTPEGLIPGAGSILAALEKATGKHAKVIGKPFPDMFQFALSRLEVRPQEALVVGDQLETDIVGGQAAGCYTALVLTGVSSKEAAESADPGPTWIESDLTSLINKLAKWK
jgi:4-nitrophenyl phosphatase